MATPSISSSKAESGRGNRRGGGGGGPPGGAAGGGGGARGGAPPPPVGRQQPDPVVEVAGLFAGDRLAGVVRLPDGAARHHVAPGRIGRLREREMSRWRTR